MSYGSAQRGEEDGGLSEYQAADRPPASTDKRFTGSRKVVAVAVGCAALLGAAAVMTGGRSMSTAKLIKLDATDRSAKEVTASVPSRWTQGGRADESATMKLHFAMKHREGLDFERELLEVSTPGSPRYGAHLSLAEMNALTTPADETVDAVQSWLARSGVSDAQNDRRSTTDYLTLDVTVGEAEKLLQTEYYEFTNEDGRSVVRASQYSVPSTVSEHLDFVAPTVQFPGMRGSVHNLKKVKQSEMPWNGPEGTMADSAESSESSYSYITPSELQTMYNFEGVAGSGNASNVQVVTAFLDEFYCANDLQTFYGKFVTDLKGFALRDEVGSTTDDDPSCGDEANLDVQYITSTAAHVQTDFWSFPGYSPDIPSINEPFLDFITYLNGLDDLPGVVSTSYGEDEGSTSEDYATRIQIEFMKAGMRGVSLLFASGDSGVASMFSSASCTKFSPQWPAGSPWVTAVGATAGVETESAADFSSGGFSNRWKMPEYQREVVTKYLESNHDLIQTYLDSEMLAPNTVTPNGTASGRAFPDVSAAGQDFMIVLDGNVYTVDGTSASTPVFAGIVSLVNEKRHHAGKKSLGFLNPMIYTYGEDIFNDITSGNNPGCGTTGFDACSGWDPITGFGSPDYQKFVDVALELP